ncbi:T9SS type A sorting domain-containing protein [Chryseobacterium capnotolerans]|uniref:T9SS type A sorting domain-containing protein n=1 Tax=Chryseobacterium TaxID=59732 RepID=UPI00083A2616|nr:MULTISPECIES: T9SS type A sorting domain-containing protein [Chryseobacterium]UHO38244.1 T9SS type A sorting domain-containing protein [Chryseobacterium capnotolerans]
MKKTIFSLAIIATNFVFGQMNLEHSYTSDSSHWDVYSDNNTSHYLIGKGNNTFDIYNANHTLYKTLTPNIPNNYLYIPELLKENYPISKRIFNTDDQLEFILTFINNQNGQRLMLIINEDGNIIKQFGNDYHTLYQIFHDAASNQNKFVISKSSGTNTITEVYALPTSTLATLETQTQNKNKLSAFPIPANKLLNIMNPGNGGNNIQVYDASGKLVLQKSFTSGEKNISIDVESLKAGVYLYKIGDQNSKFIKN